MIPQEFSETHLIQLIYEWILLFVIRSSGQVLLSEDKCLQLSEDSSQKEVLGEPDAASDRTWAKRRYERGAW